MWHTLKEQKQIREFRSVGFMVYKWVLLLDMSTAVQASDEERILPLIKAALDRNTESTDELLMQY